MQDWKFFEVFGSSQKGFKVYIQCQVANHGLPIHLFSASLSSKNQSKGTVVQGSLTFFHPSSLLFLIQLENIFIAPTCADGMFVHILLFLVLTGQAQSPCHLKNGSLI